jgi:hypothetical protein
MLVVLPALCFVLILYFLSRRQPDRDVRPLLLSAGAIWGVTLAALTELLGLLHWLTSAGVAASWAVMAAAWGAATLRLPTRATARLRPTLPGVAAFAPALPIALILIGTGLSAALGWPNQWDSLVYHLSRVDHWIQNRSVAFYPTSIVRQLFNPPMAEYAILHLRLLGGDDRWSNVAQWLAMAGCLVGVTAIARRLGAAPRGQLFSAVFCATLPMGILQASSTQNDYITAFWLVCLTEAALAPPSPLGTFRIGAGLGLALLSKGTTFVFAGPLFLLAAAGLAGTRRPTTRLLHVVSALLIALALNAPHWARNLATFGSPLGPGASGSPGRENDRLTNDALSPGILASNVIRNLSLHAGTPSRKVNRALESAVERGHEWLGVAIDDPRSTRLYSDRRFMIEGDSTDPDRAGNPLHLLLVAAAAARIALWRPARRSPGPAWYGVALAAGALLFCLVLKWQPWHSRLQLPLFVLAAPLVSVALEGAYGLILTATVLLTLQAARPLLRNRLAPLVGRHTVFNTPRLNQYFHLQPPAERPPAGLRAVRSWARSALQGGKPDADWDREHPCGSSSRRAAGGMAHQHVAVTNGRPAWRASGDGAVRDPGGSAGGDSIRVRTPARLVRRAEPLSGFPTETPC